MRVRWIVYAAELAALVGFYILIGFAFGWVIALAMGAGFIALAALTWAVARALGKRFVNGRAAEWAEWMAEKPGEGHPWPAYHRFFWRRVIPWETRVSLAVAALTVVFAVVLLIAVIVQGV